MLWSESGHGQRDASRLKRRKIFRLDTWERESERKVRDLLIGAHVRMIGADYVKRCRTLCRFFDWFLVPHGWTL